MFAIPLRRSERKLLKDGHRDRSDILSLLPKEDPKDLKSIKTGIPKVNHQEIFEDKVLFGEFDYKRPLTRQ